MNSKVLKYGLLGGVALIWGLIIYRIISGLSGDGSSPHSVPARVTVFNYNIQEDTFSLYTDYPDPFLPEENTDTLPNKQTIENQPSANVAAISSAQAPLTVTDNFNPSVIKYSGMFNNPEKKIKMAILKINEQEMILKEKEKGNDFTLQKILKDKIIISHKNKKYEIQREQ